MAAVIRLRRIGKNPKGKPYFRVTVFHTNRGRDSRFIEEVGSYNPVTGQVKFDTDRLAHWIKSGAQLSATVKRLVDKSSTKA